MPKKNEELRAELSKTYRQLDTAGRLRLCRALQEIRLRRDLFGSKPEQGGKLIAR